VSESILLEVCCGSLDDALEAAAGGADRVELNSCLFLGGLTPSLGSFIEARHRLSIPVLPMVRPRGGGFGYTEAEFAAMQRDASLFVEHGADGLVFGCLHPDGRVDAARTEALVKCARGRDAVFHRAFDVTPDPFRALDELVDLGVTRVLTSGQEPTVHAGLDLLARLTAHAGDRIEILPGGGIEPYQVPEVLARTGLPRIHVAHWRAVADPSTGHRPRVTFGGALYPPEDRYEVTDRAVVRGIRDQLDGRGPGG